PPRPFGRLRRTEPCDPWPVIFGIGGSLPDHLADLVHYRTDELRVLTFGHDPDHRLGARFADHQTTCHAEPVFAVIHGPFDRDRSERVAFGKSHTAQPLRHRRKQTADL